MEGCQAGGRGIRRRLGFTLGTGPPRMAPRVLGDVHEYLGETLDLHCGGVDLVFPHHEDEIAQSEAATGKSFSRVWCHGEFLLTDGAKMAKRVGNVSTVNDLREQGVSAAAVRHFVFSTHYRKQLNLSGMALEASMEAVRRVGDFAARLTRRRAARQSWRWRPSRQRQRSRLRCSTI